MAFSIKTLGLSSLQSRLNSIYTKEMVQEDLDKFQKRGERKRRKGLGSKRNTVKGRLRDNRLTLETTLKWPRASGKSWRAEFVRAIYPKMGKRVMSARARKIKEQWR